MRVILVLLCLVLLWGDSLSEECVRELQEDVDFPGNDVQQILSPDVHHCQLACTQHHSCLFFTFVRPEWTRDKRQFYCYLKHTDSGKPAIITSVSGATSGYSLKTCKDRSRQTCLSTVYKNVDFTGIDGVDYTSLFTADYEDCQRTCNKDPDCQFFSFLNQDFRTSKYRNKCLLKHTRVFPSPPRVNSSNGVASGFTHNICTGGSTDGKNCQYKIQTYVNFPGDDFEQVPSPSSEYCHFLCTIHPYCTFYSYARNEMLCNLKHNKVERSYASKDGMMSGTPTRFCEGSNGDCARTSYENIDFQGFDRRFVLLDDPQTCQETCTADPDCQFYTYVYETYHVSVQRRRCYLKQVITVPLPPKVVAMQGVVSGFHQRGCQQSGGVEKTECVRELQEDVDFPGSDVQQILSPDVHHCQLACTQHHSCLFFTFVRPEWTRDKRQFYCYLKHTDSGKPAIITSVSGATSGYSMKTCKDRSRQTCLSTVYKNVDFTGIDGVDYTSLFTADYEDCQRTCNKDPDCQFFSFLNQDFRTSKYRNKCLLKHTRVFPSPPRVNSLNGVASGFAHIWTGGSTDGKNCQYKIQTDMNFPGDDFEQVPSPSSEYCHFLCTIHPYCTFYSYARKEMLCNLKHNKIERSYASKDGMMSGTPTRFCEGSNGDCARTSYENIDFQGFDRRFVLLDDLQTCQETCKTDPDCQFYTYVYESFHVPVQRRRCYLKQVITVPLPPKVVAMQGVVSGFHQRGCQQSGGVEKTGVH